MCVCVCGCVCVCVCVCVCTSVSVRVCNRGYNSNTIYVKIYLLCSMKVCWYNQDEKKKNFIKQKVNYYVDLDIETDIT